MGGIRPAKGRLRQIFRRNSARSKRQGEVTNGDAINSSRNQSENDTTRSKNTTPCATPSATVNPADRQRSATENIVDEVAPAIAKTTDEQAAGIAAECAVSLWDRAYDDLKQEKRSIIPTYEDLLSRVLIKSETDPLSTPDGAEDRKSVTNEIPEHDIIERRNKLKKIIQMGLRHMEDKKVKVTILGHEISLQDSIGNVAKAVEWAQDYIKDAIKDVPYAPAVMAAVSLILPLLKNPAIVETANLEGFTYVTSQMRYYISMESLRLPEDMEPCLKFDLTSRIIDLYKLIIDFQLQTVIRFYRNGTKNYFRSTINYDQWGEKLSSIKQNECELDKKFGMAISGAGLQKLKNLALEAQNSRKSLDIIVTEIQELLSSSRESVDIMKTIHQSMSADEDRRRRGSLQATDPTLDKLRIEEEKGGLLRDSYRWILDHKDFQWWRDAGVGQLLWIKGDAGMGKTMLLCGIIDELIKLAGHTANISFFFCQASDDRVNNATAVLRGLIYMLVIQQPFLIEHVGDGPSFEGPNAWYALSRVFTNILEDRRLHSTYVIIDALDECTVDVSRLLNFVVQKSSTSSLVKWVVSSRSLPKIEKDLDDATRLYDAMPMKLDLESNREAISAAVRSFIQSKVDWLAKRNGFDQKLLHHVEQYLQSNANGIFLWVALVCQELANVDIWEVQEKLKQLPPGLDDLYKRMLTQVRESQNSGLCLSILGLVTSVYRPITLDELRSYVDLPEDISNNEGALARIIRVCGSFLTLRERVISLVHLSAKIFLLREIFPCGVADVHHSIFSRSLQIMAKTLRHDIYRLGSPGYPVGKVKHPHPDPLAVARYSCVYGIVHLQGCDLTKVIEGLRDGGPVDLFLRRDLLHWIEALSLLRSVSEGIDLMLGLESLNERTRSSRQLTDRTRDACRFIQYHKYAIEESPLQVYASALIFSPACSITRNQFEADAPRWVVSKPIMEDNWSACILTLEGHGTSVLSVAWSQDGAWLASASSDGAVRIWNSVTGRCMSTVEGHTWFQDGARRASESINHKVNILDPNMTKDVWMFMEHSDGVVSLACSPDGMRVASWWSCDETIRIWDPATGHCILTLEEQLTGVLSLTWSYDRKLLMSSAGNGTVKIWDLSKGRCISTLEVEGHRHGVFSVARSHDRIWLASASEDKMIKIWDPAISKCIRTLKGHPFGVSSVAWSHDGTRLASSSYDGTVRIWDPAKSDCLRTLEGHRFGVSSLSWSHDGRLLASSSYDTTIKIWDINTGGCVSTLEGHHGEVLSVAWSYNGNRIASSSRDDTVKIWNPATGRSLSKVGRHSDRISSVVWSHDGKRLASASEDKTVKIWDPVTSACVKTLKGHRFGVTSVAWSHDGIRLASTSKDGMIKIWDPVTSDCIWTLEGTRRHWAFSAAWSYDGKRLASASNDKTVKIWDSANRQCISTLGGRYLRVLSVAWSYNGTLLAISYANQTVKIWDPDTGGCISTFRNHSGGISSLAWSHDGKLLVSSHYDATVKIWDSNTRQSESTLEGHRLGVFSVAWSYDGTRFASSSFDQTVKIWDSDTRQCILTLGGHCGGVFSVAWSHDGRLASASEDKTIKIWDPVTSDCIRTLEGHRFGVSSVAWSHDGMRVASSSHDETIKIWNPATGQLLSTLEIGLAFHDLRFSDWNPDQLYTEHGTFDLPVGSAPPVSTRSSPSLLSSSCVFHYALSHNIWITQRGNNLLRLPSDYRATSSAVFRNFVAIGCSSGRVLFLKFSSSGETARLLSD